MVSQCGYTCVVPHPTVIHSPLCSANWATKLTIEFIEIQPFAERSVCSDTHDHCPTCYQFLLRVKWNILHVIVLGHNVSTPLTCRPCILKDWTRNRNTKGVWGATCSPGRFAKEYIINFPMLCERSCLTSVPGTTKFYQYSSSETS